MPAQRASLTAQAACERQAKLQKLKSSRHALPELDINTLDAGGRQPANALIPSNNACIIELISQHAYLSATSGGLHKDRGNTVQSLIERFRHAPPQSRRERQLESAEGSAGHQPKGAHAVCSCFSNLQAPVLRFTWPVHAALTQLAQPRGPVQQGPQTASPACRCAWALLLVAAGWRTGEPAPQEHQCSAKQLYS